MKDGNRIICNIDVNSKTMESVTADCKEWAGDISKTFTPDLIVFIAKSGFLFAKPMAEYFQCEEVDIIASRPASKVKNKLKNVVRWIPENIVLKILKSSYMYQFNGNNEERKIEISDRYKREEGKEHKNILIVDDSVDTGWTILAVQREVKKSFPNATIKTAGYAVIDYSKERVAIDYYRYKNKIILTATSRKSAEYETFLESYESWKKDKS